MIYMRNNNFRNQNDQIQNDSNNDNNDRIRKRENNSNKTTQRALKANHNNQNRDSIGDVIGIIPNKKANDDNNTNRFDDRRGDDCIYFGVCCWFLIVGIIGIGLGMICFGINHNIPFITIFGIFDFILFFVCLAFLISNDKIILFKVYSSLFFYIYLIIIDSVMFLFGFYFNFIDCSQNQAKRYKLGEKGLGFIIIFLNTIMGGLGTLIFGLSKIGEKKLTIWIKIRDIIFGIIQLTGFILLLYSIFLLPLEKDNYSKIITLLIFGCLSYCFSLYSGISICKELNK